MLSDSLTVVNGTIRDARPCSGDQALNDVQRLFDLIAYSSHSIRVVNPAEENVEDVAPDHRGYTHPAVILAKVLHPKPLEDQHGQNVEQATIRETQQG